MQLPLSIADVERTRLPLEQASLLPAAAFVDADVLAWEQAEIFGREWVCAGHVDQVRGSGDFVMVELGRDSVFVVGSEDGPRAFHNTCRHRGARLVDEHEGSAKRIRCPYHAWTYNFDGSLKSAPFTDELEGFDKACFGLKPVRLAVVEGLLLLDLSGQAPPPTEHIGDLADLLARYRTPDLRRTDRVVYDVQANWKAIAENYNECLHCPGVHPELNLLSHYLSGESVIGAGAWCGGSMTLSDGAETMAKKGHDTRPAIAGLTEAQQREVLYFSVFPNALVSLHPDYVMLHTLWPQAPDRTRVTCEWFFEPETIARADFDSSDAIQFWDQVNREDWEVCRLTQRGMQSSGYEPGRYTTQEDDVHQFDVMVADRYLQALGAEVTA